MEIWGHRGASAIWAENTLPAFEQAFLDGAEGVELDVQQSKDGQLVVCHDEHLGRLTGLDAFLFSCSWEELRQLNFASIRLEQPPCPAPLLEEVLRLVKREGKKVNIELKNSLWAYEGMEEAVVALIRRLGMEEQVLLSSFNHYSIRRLQNMAPQLATAFLFSDLSLDAVNYGRREGVSALHPHYRQLYLLPTYVEEARQAGLAVNTWTVEEEADIRYLEAVGVQAVITNNPKRARSFLRQV